MNLDLSRRRALVCGASAGIGRACAMELAALGATVILAARNQETLATVQRALATNHGQQHRSIVVDLAKPDTLPAAIKPVLADGPIHILVNNTGGPPSLPLLETTLDQLRSHFDGLLGSGHELARALASGMKSEGYGRIINITSTSVKQPIPNLGISNAVRAAVANWAKTLSLELAPFGITVNNVLPGYTDTQRLSELFDARAARSGSTPDQARDETVRSIPAGRLGTPEEIAAVVAFLASPAAAYVNGTNVTVDGGRTGSL